MRNKRIFLVILAMAMVSWQLFTVLSPPSAEAYPTKRINVIIGFGAGGPTDIIARGILPILQEKIGVGIGITNMAGASGATAADNVMRTGKDGYTLFFGSETMSLWQVMDIMNLAPKDFIPIMLVSQAIPVLAVPPDSKFKTADELIKVAVANPRQLRLATAGPGTVPHVSGMILDKELGAKFTYVPFQGGRPAITAVMGSQVDATIEMIQSMSENYKAKQLNILASFTNEPIRGLEEVPALGKMYPKLSSYLPYGPYFGLFVNKDVPAEVVTALEKGMTEALKDPRWVEYARKFYLLPIELSGAKAKDFIDKWTSKSTWAAFEAGGTKKSPAEFGIPKP